MRGLSIVVPVRLGVDEWSADEQGSALALVSGLAFATTAAFGAALGSSGLNDDVLDPV